MRTARDVTLTITSTLSALLFAFHWADEISRGMERADLSSIAGIAILIVWLCGPLVLGPRRAGYILMLITGIVGLGVLILHMSGRGMLGGRIANTSGIFFWVFTLIALGVTSGISAMLAGIGLWKLRANRLRA